MTKKYKSLFDIIGPVMVGPSSSHTAGAVKIGNMARALFNEKPDSVHIYLYESFANTYQGHATDIALLGGLLGMRVDDENLHDALYLAKSEGIDFKFIPLFEKANHPNTVKFVLRKDKRRLDVMGESLGGGLARITHIDDDEIEIMSDTFTLVIEHQDVKGAIYKVSSVLNEYQLNIATMKVWRHQRHQKAHMIIEIDDGFADLKLDRLLEYDFINKVFLINTNSLEE